LIVEDISEPSKDGSSLIDTILHILFALPEPPSSDSDLTSFLISSTFLKDPTRLRKAHIKKGQEAWLVTIRLRISKQQRKKVLGLLVHQIVPWFTRPEQFMDFLTDSYDEGGETTLLALAGIFYLMQEKNLDYPSFFQKLYSLLDSGILHSKHRSRFFRLLDTFMASTHLPAALVASFIKRLSRLALYAPPSGIVVVVPWIYNMFKRHPATTFMMHRMPRCEEEKEEWDTYGAEDPFNMEEEDPMVTGAIDSSVWELVTLQSHYHPNVATLAKIISEQFTKQAYNLEDFLDHSYNSVSSASFLKLTSLTTCSCLILSLRGI
jgi:U3 small nucleolar RNA-associated protein 19